MRLPVRPLALIALLAALCGGAARAEARLEVLKVPGKTLAGNPLRDPTERQIAVFIPSQYDAGKPLPTIYWLQGFGGGPDGFIAHPDSIVPTLQAIADAGAPAVFVAIDGRTRWACSQYINSPAQGDYAKYIAKEVVSFVEAHFHVSRRREDRVIAGHSSGGFGALRIANQFPKVFGRCVAMSPDSDFEISHRPLAMKPEVVHTPLAHIRELQDAAVRGEEVKTDGELRYITALSACYAPIGRSQPGRFEWLFDENGKFREEVWKRWMANDPLEIVRRDKRAFRHTLSVYLDGGKFDSYKANIGAAKIDALLRERGVRSTFYESPGGHGSFKPMRMQRAFLWTFKGELPPSTPPASP